MRFGRDRAIHAPVRVVVTKPGDATARIQRGMITGRCAMRTECGRGAVVESRHEVAGGLMITIPCCSAGAHERTGTVLVASGLDRALIRVVGKPAGSAVHGEIADEGSGGRDAFPCEESGGLKAGDSVRVIRPSSQHGSRGWVRGTWGRIGGGWKAGTRDLVWDRVVKAVEGEVLTECADRPRSNRVRGDELSRMNGRGGSALWVVARLESAYGKSIRGRTIPGVR
jgi:hypothetical protein